MIVCVCGNLTEKRIREACEHANGSVAQVYKWCGVIPQCGSCKFMIRELLDEVQARCTGS